MKKQILLFFAVCMALGAQAQLMVADTISSTGIWTVPAGVTSCTVYLWGGGGGGGGMYHSYALYNANSGGGGGGACGVVTISGLTTGDVYADTVGTGGNGGSGTYGYPGAPGGTSSFSGTLGAWSVQGGTGGATTGGCPGCVAPAGAGGTSGSGPGITIYAGGNGSAGYDANFVDGAGGGAGGSGGAGDSAADQSCGVAAAGGTGTYPGGAGAFNPDCGLSIANGGVNGNAPGGGASGINGYFPFNYPRLDGSVGGNGQIIIAYTVCIPTTSVSVLTICASALPYGWNGLTFTGGGSQTAHLTNAYGCDSAATLNLTVIQPRIVDLYAIIDSGNTYSAFGHTYSAGGNYPDTSFGGAVSGCDSINILHLSVTGHCTLGVSNNSSYLNPCSPMTFTAALINNSGATTYTWFRNNIQEGTGTSYTASTLNENDSVWVTAKSATTCSPTLKTAISDKIIINRGTPVHAATVNLTANNTDLDIAGSRILTATPVNAGTNPRYAWYHNGALISGATSSLMSYGGALGNGDQMYCVLTTTSCGAAQSTASNVITFTKSGSSAKEITGFDMPDQIGTSVINSGAATVNAVVSLTPGLRTAIHASHIFLSQYATYAPSQAMSMDYAIPVTITVTAQNGTTKVWTVTVLDAAGQRLDASTDNGTNIPAIEGLTIYPNPAISNITALMQGGADPAVVTILDMSGRVMYNQQLPASVTINHQVDVSAYAGGAYIINIEVGEHRETKQFIVTRQ